MPSSPAQSSIHNYKNTYAPSPPSIPRDVHLHTPPDAYDFNYVGEVRALASDRVELRPYVVSEAGAECGMQNAECRM